jgi:hypothetical protein
MAYVANTSNWTALLQEDYVQGQIVSAVNNQTPFKDKLQKTAMTGGKRRFYATQVGLAQGNGARAEGAQAPTYGAGEYQDVTVPSKYNYGMMKITGQAEEFSDRAAFVRFGLRAVKDTKEGMKVQIGRQCWGDGQGTLALVNNGAGYAAGVSTVAVDSPYGVLWGSLATNTTFLMKRKMVVTFGAENNGGFGYEITAVSATGFSFTPPLANAILDNVAVSLNGSANQEVEGILIFGATAAFQTTLGLGTTTYHGVDRSAFPEWEGNVINAGAALSLTNIRTLRDAIYKRTDDEESNLFMTSTEVARDYEALLVPNQRFIPATTLSGGSTVLEHDGLRVSKDSRAPVKAFFLADTKVILWAQTQDPHWRKDDSGAVMLPIQGQDAKEAMLRYYGNLDCEEPRRIGIEYNLTVN